MTDPPRPLCNGTAQVMCPERRASMRCGDLFYSMHYAGWIFPAEGRAVPKSLVREGTRPFVWTYCPHCGGPLPDVFTEVERLLDDTGEGEE